MEIENNISIKDDIFTIIKELIKFALVAIILLLAIGTSLLYLFIKFTKLDVEIAATLAGIVVAIFIVFIDDKKIHTVDKITECNMRIIRKVLKLF
jgi:putative flippase GtrA